MADFDDDVYEDDDIEEEGSRGGYARRPHQRGFRRRFVPRVLVCAFCVDKNAHLDYKQPDVLRRYVNDRGKIRPRRQTGMCAKHQRRLSQAVKRARHLALLPFVARVAR